MPDSGKAATDTITFRIESEACKTKRYSATHVYSEEQKYTFEKNNNVTVYESSGSAPRKDYVPESHTKVFYKRNAAGDTIGVDSIHSTINFGPELSGCTFTYSWYKLDKSKNRLSIVKSNGNDEYEILFLSSKMLMMRKIH